MCPSNHIAQSAHNLETRGKDAHADLLQKR
jgi:hypothetical protein